MRDKRGILITGASSETGMALIRKIGMNYTHVIAHCTKPLARRLALSM